MRTYETYKDSGLEWLGKVPEHWKVDKFKYQFELITTPSDSSNKIGLENIESTTGRFIKTDNEFEGNGIAFQPNDIVYGKLRPYLQKVWLADFAGNAVGDFYVFRCDETNSPAFIKYVLLSHNFTVEADGSTYGAKMPRVSYEFIGNLKWAMPPLPEQQTIASYLDHKVSQIDALIAEKEKMVADLKAYRSSVITEAVTKGLDKNAEMKESGVEWIGNIPAKWHTLQVKYILENCKDALRVGPFGSALAGNDIVSDGNIWIYNQRVVLDNNFKKNDSFIKNEKFAELSAFTVREGDILLTTRGTIGKVAIVPQDAAPGVLHPCIIKFRVNDNIVGRDFIKYIFNDTEIITNQVRYNSNSTTIDVIYSYTLKELVLPIPSITEQRDIVRSLDRKIATIDRAIKEQEHQLSDLKSYKSSLITEAVTGKIDLRGWE